MTWAPDYVNSVDLKNYLEIQHDNDDAFIALWVTTASRNIDDFCHRQFGKVAAAEDRYYTPEYDRHERAWFVDIDDLQDITSLAVTDENGTAVSVQSSTVSGYQLWPRNAAVKGKPYERVKLTTRTGELKMSGLWGWNAIPAAVKTGLFLQAARLKERRSSPFGVAGSPDQGNEIRLLAQLDPDFRTSLKPFVRKWWAA